jgi:hypothetical protein
MLSDFFDRHTWSEIVLFVLMCLFALVAILYWWVQVEPQRPYVWRKYRAAFFIGGTLTWVLAVYLLFFTK